MSEKKIYRILGINADHIYKVEPEEHTLSSGAKVLVVSVGESGRGREKKFLVVENATEKNKIEAVEIAPTRAGGLKFIERSISEVNTDDLICVFRTNIGFRGSNSHTGDRHPNKYCDPHIDNICWKEFPGKILIQGRIAQGQAGAMGSGTQMIAIMPKDVVFRTAYTGRLYGVPNSHYYLWDGDELKVATWEERVATDCF